MVNEVINLCTFFHSNKVFFKFIILTLVESIVTVSKPKKRCRMKIRNEKGNQNEGFDRAQIFLNDIFDHNQSGSHSSGAIGQCVSLKPNHVGLNDVNGNWCNTFQK